jgi:hypothetical protein
MSRWQSNRNQQLILPKAVATAMLSELRLAELPLPALIFLAAQAALTDCLAG